MVAIGTLNEHDCSKRLGALKFKVDVVLFSGLFILVVFNGNIWWAAEASTVTCEEVKQWCNISNIFASMICHPLWIFLNLFSFIDCCFKIENLLWISEARQEKIVVQTYVLSRIILQSIYRALSVYLKFFLELHKNRFQEQETFDTDLSHIFQYKANAWNSQGLAYHDDHLSRVSNFRSIRHLTKSCFGMPRMVSC